MSDCCFGASPVIYNDPDPDPDPGRAVAEISRKGRRFGHVLLANSWEVIYIVVYGKFLSVLHLNKSYK